MDRLSPYLAATHGDGARAVELYQWNVELSGAVYECLHIFEVVLRNAMDRQLCIWNATQSNRQTGIQLSSEWLLDPAPLLRRLVRSAELAKAHSRASSAIRGKGRTVCHGDLLAQLSFGTWRFLLPDSDPGRQYLWRASLSRAFPHLARTSRDLVDSVDGIYRLRNRVAHLEPLLRVPAVRQQIANMHRVLGEIDPDVAHWYSATERASDLLLSRP